MHCVKVCRINKNSTGFFPHKEHHPRSRPGVWMPEQSKEITKFCLHTAFTSPAIFHKEHHHGMVSTVPVPIGERPFKRWQREHGLQICKKNDIVMTRDLKIPKIRSDQSSPVPPGSCRNEKWSESYERAVSAKVTSQDMVNKIRGMRSEEINTYLTELGCTLTCEDIRGRLEATYNDLAVADAIFETQKIDDTHATFPKAFIDEAVLEIARREDFGFTHYGLISDAILDLMEQGSEQVAADLLEQFRLLFKTAKRFHIDSLEAMMYQVNDGLDMIGVVTFLLDILMEQGRRDKEQYRVLIAFVDKFLHVFSKTSDFFRVGMQYEQAKAYIALKSKKGEQMFQKLLATHSDVTDVVLHYALAYLDDDEKRTRRLLERYASRLDKESPAYEEIQELKKMYITNMR